MSILLGILTTLAILYLIMMLGGTIVPGLYLGY